MNSTFGSLALAVLLAAAGAQAVAQEPPAVATKPAAAPQKAVPPAAPSAAAPAVAPAAPSAQIPSDKVRLSPAEIAAKEKTLDEKIARYRSRTTEGEAITGKWGALSELYKKYGTEAAGVELSCDVVKDRFKRAKESGLSDFMIKELSSDVKECDQEVVRVTALRSAYDRQLTSVSEAVDRAEQEAKMAGEQAENALDTKKRLALEKQVNQSLEDAIGSLKRFDPKNKSIPTN